MNPWIKWFAAAHDAAHEYEKHFEKFAHDAGFDAHGESGRRSCNPRASGGSEGGKAAAITTIGGNIGITIGSIKVRAWVFAAPSA